MTTASPLGGSFDGVLFENVDVFDINRKGYYFEALSNAVITNFEMTNVGEWGGIPATGSNGQGGERGVKRSGAAGNGQRVRTPRNDANSRSKLAASWPRFRP